MSPASYQTAPPRDACCGPVNRALYESGKRDSNPRPRPWQGRALPTELFPQLRSANLGGPAHRRNLSASGGEGDRTPDLVNAIHALSQLSYAPAILPSGLPEGVRKPSLMKGLGQPNALGRPALPRDRMPDKKKKPAPKAGPKKPSKHVPSKREGKPAATPKPKGKKPLTAADILSASDAIAK